MLSTEVISFKNRLNKYHDDAFRAAQKNQVDEFAEIIKEALPLANEVYVILGKPAQIRTAVTFNRRNNK